MLCMVHSKYSQGELRRKGNVCRCFPGMHSHVVVGVLIWRVAEGLRFISLVSWGGEPWADRLGRVFD